MKFSLILLLLSTSVGWSQCTGFSYRASMTTSGQASSLSGFDSILGDTYDGSGGEPDFRSVANGGTVTSSSGHDFCFADNTDGSSPITFYRELYTDTSGAVRFYLRRTLGTSSNVYYVFWGKSGASDLSSAANTFPTSEYDARYSMEDGNDSTSNSYNGTAVGTPATVAGKIGNAQQLSGSNYYNNANTRTIGTDITLSCWLKLDAGVTQSKYEMFQGSSDYSQWSIEFPFGVSTYDITYSSGTATRVTTTSTWPTSWTYYVVTRTGTGGATSVTEYVNGTSIDSGTASGTGAAHKLSSGDSLIKIAFLFGAGNLYSDECRIETVVRNADFIAARYNAQNSPSSFITMGSPVSLGSIPFKRIFRVGD